MYDKIKTFVKEMGDSSACGAAARGGAVAATGVVGTINKLLTKTVNFGLVL